MNHLFGVNWEYPWVLVAVPILPFVAWALFRGKLGRSAPLSLPKIMRRWAGVRAVVDRVLRLQQRPRRRRRRLASVP